MQTDTSGAVQRPSAHNPPTQRGPRLPPSLGPLLPVTPLEDAIRAALRTGRIKKGLTQQQLTKIMGLSSWGRKGGCTIGVLEQGRRKLRFGEMARLAILLDVSIDETLKQAMDLGRQWIVRYPGSAADWLDRGERLTAERDAALELAALMAECHEQASFSANIVDRANVMLNMAQGALLVADDALYGLILREALDRASKQAAKAPQWMRDAVRAMRDDINRPDPCRCPRRCDEAQTCVEGCAYE